jgi:putative membrane protein
LDLNSKEIEIIASKTNVPIYLIQIVRVKIEKLKQEFIISNEDFLALDLNLNSLIDGLGACERIKSTPIPFSYSLFLKKFIFIYVVTMPLAFVATFGYLSALIATFVFYVLVSMEVLAEEIEDPFGKDDNDLPTDDLSSRIQTVVEDTLK